VRGRRKISGKDERGFEGKKKDTVGTATHEQAENRGNAWDERQAAARN